jgi:hypothetical protein
MWLPRGKAEEAMEPERPDPGPIEPGPSPLSPAERGRIKRAAALRPLNVMVLVIGAGVFVTTLAWWVPPLTLLTYALLVFLSARDLIFRLRVLHGREEARRPSAAGSQDISPERRAHWLPRGETRERVEATLVVYRKVVVAIEESDDVTRAVLGDAVPKLHAAANRLVDVAQRREKAGGGRDGHPPPSAATPTRPRSRAPREGTSGLCKRGCARRTPRSPTPSRGCWSSDPGSCGSL